MKEQFRIQEEELLKKWAQIVTICGVIISIVLGYIGNGNWKEYIKWKKQYKVPSNIIGTWFLDCKYNPKYKYCKDRLNEEYDSLYS